MKLLLACFLLVLSTNSFSQDTRLENHSAETEANENFEESKMHVLDLNLSGISYADQQELKLELYKFNNYVISIEIDESNSSLRFKHLLSLPKTSVLVFLENLEISHSRIINY